MRRSSVAAIVSRARWRSRAQRIAVARDDVNAFMEYCFLDATGLPVRQGTIHRQLQAHLTAHSMAGVEFPRDHGKSTQVAIGRVIFELGRNPNLRIKLVANDLPKARKRVRAVRAHIDSNRRVREVFPDLISDDFADDWTSVSLTVKRPFSSPEPSLEARGILTAATGGRADLLIFDDVCDHQNTIKNPNLRPMVKKAFYEDWMNLLEPHGRAFYLATPWHAEDLTHDLLKNAEWVFLRVAINDRLDPVWPEVWSREALQRRLALIGMTAFTRGFKCRIVPEDDDAIFRDVDLELAKDFDLTVREALELTRAWPKYIGVDLAAGKKTKKSKYSVLVAIAVDPVTRQRVPLQIQRRREPAPRFFRRLCTAADALRPEAIIVENNGVQQAMIDLAREDQLRGLPLKSLHTGREKADLEIGLPGLAAEFESRLWRLPYGGPPHPLSCMCGLCVFLLECKGGLVGATTDVLMAAWLSTRLITRRAAAGERVVAFSRSGLEAEWDPHPIRDDSVVGSRRPPHHDPGW